MHDLLIRFVSLMKRKKSKSNLWLKILQLGLKYLHLAENIT